MYIPGLLEAYGPVRTEATDPYWVGATVRSNTTAEYTALIELLLLLETVTRIYPGSIYGANIYTDSEVALKTALGIYTPNQNLGISNRLVSLYTLVASRIRLNIHWVEAHVK